MPNFQQTGSGTRQGPIDKEALKEQIKQTVQAATQAAQEAADEAGAGGRLIVLPPGAPMPLGGTLVPPGFGVGGSHNEIPPQALDIVTMFFVFLGVIIIGYPLARAFGRRLERRPAEPAAINPAMTEQLQRIEQAVDAMSIEVERISESQRFMARLQNAQTPDRIG